MSLTGLYKYRSLDLSSRERTLRSISHREIWFASLSDFNDPFEGRVSVKIDGTDENWLREFACPRPDQNKLDHISRELDLGATTS